MKPLVPKVFTAKVYRSATELEAECAGLASDTAVIVSEVVSFIAEARCFVLDGAVLDCAVYEGEGESNELRDAASELARSVRGPRTFVMDLGLIPSKRWGLVEFNASWGAGLNGCDAERVLPAIEAATRSFQSR